MLFTTKNQSQTIVACHNNSTSCKQQSIFNDTPPPPITFNMFNINLKFDFEPYPCFGLFMFMFSYFSTIKIYFHLCFTHSMFLSFIFMFLSQMFCFVFWSQIQAYPLSFVFVVFAPMIEKDKISFLINSSSFQCCMHQIMIYNFTSYSNWVSLPILFKAFALMATIYSRTNQWI